MPKSYLIAASLVAVLTAVPAAAQDVDYTLVNSSSLTVLEFYTSATTDESWGEDLLATADILPGESGVVTIADGGETCEYDVAFLFDDGSELTDTVDICELETYELYD